MNKFTKFVVGTVAALALTLVVSASVSAAYMQTSTLKIGSKGSQVVSLQQTLNMTSCKVATSGVGSAGMESSTFGPKTKAAVQCFQAANGLTADGVVGPMTGAKIAAASAGTVSTGLPAGCSSSTGFSTVSGAPCSGTPGTTVYPAGCVSSVGFSSTTGVACSSSSTPIVGGPLSINTVTAGSGYTATNVGVGEQNKQVADLRIVTGAGGTGNLTGLNVTFKNTVSAGDYQFIKYASNVGVWLNGVQVGSLPATSFTSYNNAYSAYIPLSGAMLAPNTTSDLYIAISALPVIDTANLTSTNNTFSVTGTSLRYSDSTGSAFQYSVADSALSNSTFVFNTSASSNNIKLNVTKDVNDSTDHTIQASASSNTQGLTLALIDLNAQGTNVNVQSIPVTVGVLKASGATGTNVSDIVSTLRLYNSAGTLIDSETVPAGASCASTVGSSLTAVSGALCATVTFTNFNNNTLAVPVGTTNVYTIKGDVNTVNGTTFTAGTYAVAELTPTNVTSIQAYDVNNNRITGSTYLVGSTTGSKNYFYVNGINVAASGSTTNTYSNPGGAQSHGIFTMTIPFSVTSYGTTSYIPSATNLVTAGSVNNPTATAGAYIQYAVDNGSALLSGASANITYTGNDPLTVDSAGNYQIPVGQTKTFNLVVTYAPSAGASYRAQLVNVNSNTTDSSTTYSTYTAGLNTNQFRTAYVAGQ